MKLKHTEGPWTFDCLKNEYNFIEWFVVKDNPSKSPAIAKIYGLTEGQRQTNAKLISCAPDFIEDKIKDYKEIGKWLSAALEEDRVCAAMKQDIRNWFKRFDTFEKATGVKIEEVVNER